jgi:FkbM family methyltransferase
MHKFLNNLFKTAFLSSSLLLYSAENKETLFIKQFINSGDLVFDVGAHKGAKTDIYLHLGADVICIEPQPAYVELLQKKYQHNPHVTILNKGLSNLPGEMCLHICSKAPTISTFSKEWQQGRFKNYIWDKTAIVPVITLDEAITNFGIPNFCKVDVEGYELQVLQGLSQPIPYISFEFTKELFKNSKLCIQHLENLGYVFFNYALAENPTLILQEWVSAEALIKEIEKNPDSLLWGDIYAYFN